MLLYFFILFLEFSLTFQPEYDININMYKRSKLIKIFNTEENANTQITELNKQLNITAIAKKYNVNKDTVSSWFKTLNIFPNKDAFKKSLTGRNPKKKPDKTIITKDFLYNEYNYNHKTQQQIANETGIAKWTIQKLFKEYNIPVRTIKNSLILLEEEKKLNDKEWLYNNHVIQKKSMAEISREIGTSDLTVARKITEYNIPKNQSPGNYIWDIFKNKEDAIKTLTELNRTKTLTEIGKMYNLTPGAIMQWFKRFKLSVILHQSSIIEEELFTFLQSNIKEECIRNDRKFLNRKEIDIWIPEKKIGIEINGVFSHCQLIKKNKNYHLIKTTLTNKKKGKLFQFYDIEWYNKKEIIKSMILNSLGYSKVLYARDTEICELSHLQMETFLNETHIQGSVFSKIRLGLKYQNELVAVMCFKKSHRDKTFEWELSRFSCKLNYRVIGGASKLLSYFKKQYFPKSILSYADKRISQGKLYETLGFQLIKELKPDYYYVDIKIPDKKRTLYRKEKFRHKYLKQRLTVYDPSKTELQNTENNGIYRIYDCGKLKFVWNSIDI